MDKPKSSNVEFKGTNKKIHKKRNGSINKVLKDWTKEAFLKSISRYSPKRISLPHQVLPDPSHVTILNMGDEGASVGFALAAMINLLRRVRGHLDLVSPRMLQENAHLYSKTTHGQGTFLWAGFLGWRENGVCLEELWPYVPGRPGTPSEEANESALVNRPTSIIKITPKIEHLKAAINDMHAAVASAKMHNGWYSLNPEKAVISPPKQASDYIVRIALAIIGYTEEGFLIQNCWGRQWGGVIINSSKFPGCAIWSYEDFQQNCDEAWTAKIPGTALPRRS